MDLAAAPAPKYSEEIFPLEVWAIILDNLESPTDLANCYQTCQVWAELLKPKRTNFLMPQVFPILRGYLLDSDDENDEDKGISRRTINKEELEKEILNLRPVSRFWKESVDKDCQDDPNLNKVGFMEKDNDDSVFFSVCGPYNFNIRNSSKLESVFGKNFAAGSNPFINRHVKYNEWMGGGTENRLQQRLRSRFKTLLESFGSEIWTCALDFSAVGPLLYELLHSFLSLMPNLKYLKVGYKGLYSRKSSPKQFKCLLRNQPFPTLEHLRMLRVRRLPAPLTAGFLIQNCHLRKLSIVNRFPDGSIPNPVVSVQCTKLEQLALHDTREVEFVHLPKVTWPLKSLYLCLGWEATKFSTVFPTVSTFSSTLEHLILDHCHGPGTNSELHELRLELPNLKKFKLHTYQNLKTIDFLVGCTALEEIELSIYIPSADQENDDLPQASVIQFKDCINSMEQSNIFQILTQLQLLQITKFDDDENEKFNCRFTRRMNGTISRKQKVLSG